ncbi:LOW QUALITY PROTEIN: hypothetical protein SETIT_2G362500v2 [Setaria italica]|uniref:Uncharacterized protein n=1 Tax=Setaria italica TaxID=4555 RepID=A0A368Q7H3_SETIT|nr:LOW QUALITY PROTEIN: hypothetical protein SETIT_2G362500v2 [Setaria italica]
MLRSNASIAGSAWPVAGSSELPAEMRNRLCSLRIRAAAAMVCGRGAALAMMSVGGVTTMGRSVTARSRRADRGCAQPASGVGGAPGERAGPVGDFSVGSELIYVAGLVGNERIGEVESVSGAAHRRVWARGATEHGAS